MEHFLEVKNLEVAEAMLRGIPNGIERAVARTVNKALGKVKTEMKAKVTSEYNIKKMEVEKLLVLQKANFSTLRGSISAKSHRTPLIKFMTSRSENGITVEVNKSEMSKILRGNPKYYGKPFLATMLNGHKGIFQRSDTKRRKMTSGKNEGKKQVPIAQLYSLSISEMLGSETVSEYAIEKGQDYLEQIMAKEVDRILKGYVK